MRRPRIPRPTTRTGVAFWAMAFAAGVLLRMRAARCWRTAHEGRLPVGVTMEARLQHQLRRTAVALERRAEDAA